MGNGKFGAFLEPPHPKHPNHLRSPPADVPGAPSTIAGVPKWNVPSLGGVGRRRKILNSTWFCLCFIFRSECLHLALVEKISHPVFTYALILKSPQEPTLKWCAPKFVWGVSHRSSMLSLLSQQKLGCFPSFAFILLWGDPLVRFRRNPTKRIQETPPGKRLIDGRQ